MTLESAIKHCYNVADKCLIHGEHTPLHKISSDAECSSEHRQLGNWLKELKELRDGSITERNIYTVLNFYGKLEDRATEVFNLLEIKKDSRESVCDINLYRYDLPEFKDEEVCVRTTYTCWNESNDNWYYIPLRYLWMSNDEILEEVRKKREEEEKKKRLEEEEKLRKAAEVNAKRERAEYERLKAKFEALDKRNKENCVSCIHYRATCPCWKADNPEVKKWLNCEGEYSDLKKACPEWYDEY